MFRFAHRINPFSAGASPGRLDVTALSEPIERIMNEPPPGLLSNAKFDVMEEDDAHNS